MRNEIIDLYLLNLIRDVYHGNTFADLFLGDSMALAAIFTLLYLGLEGYKMVLGDKQLEILPLLRPFAIGLLIAFWIPFINVISYPFDVLTDKAESNFHHQSVVIDNLSKERTALMDSVAMKMVEASLDAERAETESRKSIWAKFGIDMDKIKSEVSAMWIMTAAKIRQYLLSFIEYVFLVIYQAFVMIVFFLQLFFKTILVILGPIAWALSILPAFRNSGTQWLARFISVNLYAIIAYLLLAMSFFFIQYCLEREISLLRQVASDETAFLIYSTSHILGFSAFLMILLVGAISMLTVPFISTWVVQTSGVGSAVGVLSMGTAKAGAAGTKLASKKR